MDLYNRLLTVFDKAPRCEWEHFTANNRRNGGQWFNDILCGWPGCPVEFGTSFLSMFTYKLDNYDI